VAALKIPNCVKKIISHLMRVLNREVAHNEKGYSATKPLILVDMQIRHLPRYPPGPAKKKPLKIYPTMTKQ
jgi:hypothetical protein